MAPVQKHSLQSLQIIIGALLSGVVGFAAVAVVFGSTVAPSEANSTFQWALLGVAAALVVGLGWVLLQLPSRDRFRSAVERAGRANY